jgi:hypothetical protein
MGLFREREGTRKEPKKSSITGTGTGAEASKIRRTRQGKEGRQREKVKR